MVISVFENFRDMKLSFNSSDVKMNSVNQVFCIF